MSNEHEANREPAAPVSDTAKQVLEDLQKEGMEIENPPSNIEVKETLESKESEEKSEEQSEDKEEKEETPPEKKEEKPDKKDDEKPPKVNRKPSQMPAWQHKVAEDKWEKEKSELLATIESLKNPSHTEPTKKDAEITEEKKEDVVDEYRAMEEKYGASADFVKDMKKIIQKELGIDPTLISEVQKIKEERDSLYENQQFDAEFSTIESTIREQYPDITANGLSKVKDQLKKMAFTDEYAKVPLKKIFKAESDSIEVPQTPKRKSAEGGRTGASRGSDTPDFDNLDEEGFANLSSEDALKYASHMSKKSGKTWNTR